MKVREEFTGTSCQLRVPRHLQKIGAGTHEREFTDVWVVPAVEPLWHGNMLLQRAVKLEGDGVLAHRQPEHARGLFTQLLPRRGSQWLRISRCAEPRLLQPRRRAGRQHQPAPRVVAQHRATAIHTSFGENVHQLRIACDLTVLEQQFATQRCRPHRKPPRLCHALQLLGFPRPIRPQNTRPTVHAIGADAARGDGGIRLDAQARRPDLEAQLFAQPLRIGETLDQALDQWIDTHDFSPTLMSSLWALADTQRRKVSLSRINTAGAPSMRIRPSSTQITREERHATSAS